MKKEKYFKTLITYFSLYLQAVKEEPKDTNKDTDTKPKVQYSIIIKKSHFIAIFYCNDFTVFLQCFLIILSNFFTEMI